MSRFRHFYLTFLGTEDACKWASNPNQYAFDLISASCLIRRVRLAYIRENHQKKSQNFEVIKEHVTVTGGKFKSFIFRSRMRMSTTKCMFFSQKGHYSLLKFNQRKEKSKWNLNTDNVCLAEKEKNKSKQCCN